VSDCERKNSIEKTSNAVEMDSDDDEWRP